jgi:2-methoxy-6-polyprenyl-1,4-benzoquinol methylase
MSIASSVAAMKIATMLSRATSRSRPVQQVYLRSPRLPKLRSFHLSATCNLPDPSTSSSNDGTPEDERTTHFGFQTVPESEKQSRVANVFSSVATSYDTMNDLMSLSIHRLWKDHFVRSLLPSSPTSPLSAQDTAPLRILDMAGGTGDIALRLLSHPNISPSSSVTISDINPDMLAAGNSRVSTSYPHLLPQISFLEANAEQLPLEDNTFDIYTVAFGIRNFTHKPLALREAFRVLKPGGVFACLEFSTVTNPMFNALYKRWSFSAIPLIGQFVAGDRDSYQYLVESIEKFPDQESWKVMIEEAGFVISEGGGYENLSGGIAAIHKGMKPL